MDAGRSKPRSAFRDEAEGLKTQTELEDHGQHGQVAHTLTACCRCRQRKTRCDPGLPRCSPCERNNAVCDYFDTAKGRNIPRSYVVRLQEKVRALESELASLNTDSKPPPLDIEVLVRGAGLVKIKENDESRFLGPASGIAMTRLVMELAKELCNTTSIKEIVPESMAQGIRDRLAAEASKPTSKVYPLISFVAAPTLPTQELTDKLVENYNAKAQIHYPVLHEPSFHQVVRDVYAGSTDDYKNFTLRMVIALSMHKLDTQYAGLADSYYLAALPYLENAIRPMNLGTLQCFSLIAEYSMTTPTRTAAYWVVGLATKLLQELGMTDEATISSDATGNPLDAIQVDLRRRLFWVIGTMELGLAHSLGRPSAFAFTHDHLDVKPFLSVDDEFITSTGVVAGSPLSLRKQVAIHFMKMRYLQLEVRRTLYLKKRPTPLSDSDPWFTQMEAKINEWMATYPRNGDGNDIGETWFKIRYNTMIVFLFRPSPQVPQPSIRAALLCFDASQYNIHYQKQQIDSKSADMTWIFAQQLFMAINTILWAMSYAEIREEHPRHEVEKHLDVSLEAIWWASKKWPGVESALELYTMLVQACLKAYDGNSRVSYGLGSPLNQASAPSPQSFDTPEPLSSPSTVHSTIASAAHVSPQKSPTPFHNTDSGHSVAPGPSTPEPGLVYGVNSRPSTQVLIDHASLSGYESSPPPNEIVFDPQSLYNPLPPAIGYGYGQTTTDSMLPLLAQDRAFFMGPLGDDFTPCFQYMNTEPMDGLNLKQQSELMNTLETYGINSPPRDESQN